MYSRYDALKETHGSEEMGHEETSSSETGTEKHQNVTETEKRKNDSCKAENALNVPYIYEASTHCNRSKDSCMTGRASEKVMHPTITDVKMDDPRHVARQLGYEVHDTNKEIVSSKGADIENEDERERESKRFSVRAEHGGIRKPPVLTSLNDANPRYGLNRLLGISVLLSGKKVTALVDSGCEAELIISKRFAQNHGIATAETVRSGTGIADETILPDETAHVLCNRDNSNVGN